MLAVCIFVLLAGLSLCARIALVLQEHASPTHKAPRKQRLKVCVVLGSGGHTSEMLGTLRVVPRATWKTCDLVYIVSATDKDSVAVAERFERDRADRDAKVILIPRAREVGQSYLTSVPSTLRALYASVACVWAEGPDIILTNGPGVCVPVVGAALLISAVTFCTRPAVAYFESFTCVDHLSVSGMLLFPVVDVFTVQWKSLFHQLRSRKQWLRRVTGRLWFTGPTKTSALEGLPHVGHSNGVALVTVGSTKFDDLMRHTDTPAFFSSLKLRGIRRCLIQKGRSDYVFTTLVPSVVAPTIDPGCVHGTCEGVEVEIFSYRPFLQDILRSAELVVSHAGAGTILEALAHRTALVVVPNTKLMSNHQLQLARSLAEERYLFLVTADKLCDDLQRLDTSSLFPFPEQNEVATMDVFRRLFRRDL